MNKNILIGLCMLILINSIASAAINSYTPTRKNNWNSQNILFTASITNCTVDNGDTPFYKWYLNNTLIGSTAAISVNTSSYNKGDYIVTGYCMGATTANSTISFNLTIIGKDEFLVANFGENWDKCGYNYDTYCYTYANMTQYIKDLTSKVNVLFITDAGDHTMSLPHLSSEWTHSKNALIKLNGTPFAINFGNHDYDYPFTPLTTYDVASYFNFSNDLVSTATKISGHSETAQYQTSTAYAFNSSWGKFILMSLEPCPSNSTLTWALNLANANKDKNIILVAHNYLYLSGKRGDNSESDLDCSVTPYLFENTGEKIWEKFVNKTSNVIIVTSAHYTRYGNYSAEAHLTSAAGDGHLVYQNIFIHTSYTDPYGGNGYIQLYKINQTNTVIKSYSVNSDSFNESFTKSFSTNYSQFNFNPINLAIRKMIIKGNIRILN